MAEALAEVEARLGAVRDLQGLVSAMRTLAASRVQQAQAALPALRAYAREVAEAIASALDLLPAPAPPRRGPRRAPAPAGASGLILFCAEHGFAGAHSRRVLEAARAPGRAEPAFFVLGSRGVAHAEEHGVRPSWTHPMATQAAAVPDLARRVTEELYRRFSAGSLGAVEVVFARQAPSGRPELVRRPLLPVPPDALRAPRRRRRVLVHLEPRRLLELLAGEYFYAGLAHAAMESLGSENAARLATLQGAKDSLERTADELGGLQRRLRQEQITAEILEIVVGAETASDPGG